MANEKRLIDAKEYCKELYEEMNYPGRSEEFMMAIDVAIADLADAPTVDAVEVVHGRWEPRTDAWGFVRCSVCCDCNIYDDWADGKKWQYCPNCGAKMDGDGNG